MASIHASSRARSRSLTCSSRGMASDPGRKPRTCRRRLGRPVECRLTAFGCSYTVQLDRVGITRADGSHAKIEAMPQPIRLDSGSTLSYLTRRVVKRIAREFPTARPWSERRFVHNREILLYRVDCSVRKLQGSVDFTFGDTTIKVSYRDMVMVRRQYGIRQCLLGVAAMPTGEGPMGHGPSWTKLAC